MASDSDYCFYHSFVKVSGSCERCNRPLCSDCIYTFKDPTIIRYLPSNNTSDHEKMFESTPEYDLPDLSIDASDVEDLNWCYPCYFDHFNPEIIKSSHFMRQILSSFINGILVAVMPVLMIFAFASDPELNITLSNELYGEIFIFMFIIGFIGMFFYNRNMVNKKQTDFKEFSENYFQKLNLDQISFPVTCYYCKEPIKSDSFACLNIDCTLGEKIDLDAPVINIQPRNLDFYDSLRELEKD